MSGYAAAASTCLTCHDLQAVRKLHGHLKAVKEAAVERSMPQAKPITLTPQEQTLDEDLDEAAQVCSMHNARMSTSPLVQECNSALIFMG